MIVTNELISMDFVENRLTAEDDPGAWREFLAIIGEEFVERYRDRCLRDAGGTPADLRGLMQLCDRRASLAAFADRTGHRRPDGAGDDRYLLLYTER